MLIGKQLWQLLKLFLVSSVSVTGHKPAIMVLEVKWDGFIIAYQDNVADWLSLWSRCNDRHKQSTDVKYTQHKKSLQKNSHIHQLSATFLHLWKFLDILQLIYFEIYFQLSIHHYCTFYTHIKICSILGFGRGKELMALMHEINGNFCPWTFLLWVA